MAKTWAKPIYELTAPTGKPVKIDVTLSVSPGLPPHKVLIDDVIPVFKERNVHTILDFGAGALRHAFPLLRRHFQVCAVEFEECYNRPVCQKKRRVAERHAAFCSLVWPGAFKKDRRKWDAAILCYVLQVMPLPKERDLVLSELKKKVTTGGYLLYMSRFGQLENEDRKYRVSDGYYKSPEREAHSFYTEFATDETHERMRRYGFERMMSLSARGTEQIFLYHKPDPFYA